MFECVILNIHSNKKTPYTVRKIIAGVYGFPFQNADTALHFHQEVRYGTQNLQKWLYAKTREECERLLDEMIPKVWAEIKAEKKRIKEEQAAQE